MNYCFDLVHKIQQLIMSEFKRKKHLKKMQYKGR